MKTYFFNADYEESLFHGKNTIRHSRFNQELEHLFFWVEDSLLLTQRQYSDQYLDYIQSHIHKQPRVIRSRGLETIFYWGPLLNLDLEQKLNSKKTSYEIAKRLGILHSSSKIVIKESDIVLDDQYIYKTFFGVSGRGHIPGSSLSRIKSELKKYPLILEKKLNRIGDFSYLMTQEKGLFTQTKVDKNFHYKGTILSNQFDWPADDISFEDYLKKIDEINMLLASYGASAPWSIDGFFYEEDKQIKTIVMCEINVRKTMGYMTYLLSLRLGKQFKYSALLLTHKTNICLQAVELCLKLSPNDNKLNTYFIGCSNLKSLTDIFNQA